MIAPATVKMSIDVDNSYLLRKGDQWMVCPQLLLRYFSIVYALLIKKQALLKQQILPLPEDWGWMKDGEGYVPRWATLQEACRVNLLDVDVSPK